MIFNQVSLKKYPAVVMAGIRRTTMTGGDLILEPPLLPVRSSQYKKISDDSTSPSLISPVMKASINPDALSQAKEDREMYILVNSW